MKRILMTLSLFAAMFGSALAGNNPKANPDAVVVSGNARFTVLTPEIIRIEYSQKGQFEDNATFAIVNRNLPVPAFTKTENDSVLTIVTDKVLLRYRKGSDPRTESNLTAEFSVGNEIVQWHPGKADPLNLKGTCRTLDGCDGDNKRSEMEDGILSRSGWAVINDSPAATRGDGSQSLAFVPNETMGFDWAAQRGDADALDIYLMAYGHDYKRALHDFTLIAGKIPLPPAYVFGYWYSRYSAYTSQDYRDIMAELNSHDINTDVLILDMDWHWNGNQEVSDGRGGWTGWTWNTRLIPDPEKLLADIHANDMKLALNLHPADGVAADEDFYKEIGSDIGFDTTGGNRIPWMLESDKFAASFFKHIIRTREAQGVDFWWIDWQQTLVNKRQPGLGETFWCNHVFFNDMIKNRPNLRPMIFHRWGGLGSHRYQIGFSGDARINYPTLAFEPYFTATASNVGYAYWGHDLGGHMYGGHPMNDPELFLRWLQFGVFTPIFRTHATNSPDIERRIWLYDNFPLMNQAVKLRYALLPYIYSMARKTYETGVGICRPLYYEYPELDEAYSNEDHYFFGDDILVAPIIAPSTNGVAKRNVWLPQGEWWSPDLGKMLQGGSTQELSFTDAQIPYFIKKGAVIVKNPVDVKRMNSAPARLVLDIIGGADGETSLYEDGGNTPDYDTAFAKTRITHTAKKGKTSITIAARIGQFEGMPAQRSYTINLLNSANPKQVKVNGEKADFAYDSDSRCLRLLLTDTACDRETKIDIKY